MHLPSHTGWVNHSEVYLSHKSHLRDHSYCTIGSKTHSYCITGSKTQLCHLCNKEFTRLQEHYRTHTGEKPYKCGVCDRLFSLKSSLKRHLTIHTGDKRHQCSFCFKWLSSKCSLRSHELRHENFKISNRSLKKKHIRCEIRFKNVFNKGNLIHHYRTHEKDTCNCRGVISFKCEMCSKQFTSASTFKRHLRMHS
jgi:KRAB domain-containing zinc finger protein